MYVNRNNCVVKTIFVVCLLLQRGMNTSWIILITIFSVTLFGGTFFATFHSVSIFNVFILLVRFYAVIYVYWPACVHIFDSFLMSNCWGYIQMLLFLTFWILKVFVACKDNLFNLCLMCDLMAVIYTYFHTPLHCMHPFIPKECHVYASIHSEKW